MHLSLKSNHIKGKVQWNNMLITRSLGLQFYTAKHRRCCIGSLHTVSGMPELLHRYFKAEWNIRDSLRGILPWHRMTNGSLATRQLLSSRLSWMPLANSQLTMAGSKTVLSTKSAVTDLLSQGNTVTIRWVPEHINVWGNERADELAKLGSTIPFIGTASPMLHCESRMAESCSGSCQSLGHSADGLVHTWPSACPETCLLSTRLEQEWSLEGP